MADKHTFRDLIVWRKAVELSKLIYQVTQAMPESERFSLTSQMRRATVSIASNIAEGNARQTTRDFLNYLAMARGSLAELETQLVIAHELKMLASIELALERIREVRRLLQALIESLRRKLQT